MWRDDVKKMSVVLFCSLIHSFLQRDDQDIHTKMLISTSTCHVKESRYRLAYGSHYDMSLMQEAFIPLGKKTVRGHGVFVLSSHFLLFALSFVHCVILISFII